ncbi:TadE/TadG family type IV pilus assembly protein [Desulfofundulus thermosubterraneus]|uniref:TadE-like protein n=1 Tax=Desulfofundulus thermosubterraneus DSM 16057 TaxID=1121432 RepID=A0A1M6D7R8_9FIRM|nr:TadE/TadG family type IV pilus assembly protein [Desulfofundulus thermosubterraneus]SHI69267.1 TadE-like protein [Desulfofundulus thermosubterraneus DSM 16057]
MPFLPCIGNNRGQAMVELAIVLPVVILILMGIFEFGRVFYAYQMVTNASREGARLAALGRPDSEVVERATAAAGPVGTLEVSISPPPGTRSRGTPVTVTVSTRVEVSIPFFADKSYIVRGSTTMMVE